MPQLTFAREIAIRIANNNLVFDFIEQNKGVIE